MRSHVLEFALMLAFIALASAGLFKATSYFETAAVGHSEDTLPFGCTLPPGVTSAEASCPP
jgi:hypothetical protein